MCRTKRYTFVIPAERQDMIEEVCKVSRKLLRMSKKGFHKKRRGMTVTLLAYGE